MENGKEKIGTTLFPFKQNKKNFDVIMELFWDENIYSSL